MAITDRIDNDMSDKKIGTRVALIEQSQEYTQGTLGRIEKKIDLLDRKIDKVENKIYSNLRWFVAFAVPALLAIAGFSFEIYKYVRHE